MDRFETYDDYLAAQRALREGFCRERGLDQFWMDSWSPADRNEFIMRYRALAREYGKGAAAIVGAMK